MKKVLNVICFFWQGERWQYKKPNYEGYVNERYLRTVEPVNDALAARYVDNLFLGIKKWANQPFNFICFTNEELKVNENIQLRPFQLVSKKGVLARFYMFSKDAGLFDTQVLCLDLDVVIVGPLDDLMNYRGQYCVRNRWIPGQEHQGAGDIVSFQAGEENEKIFWDPLIKDPLAAVKATNGYEPYWIDRTIGEHPETWDDVAPKQIFSYKHHVRGKGVPDNARIISCHGSPRPHQIEEEWRTNNWK